MTGRLRVTVYTPEKLRATLALNRHGVALDEPGALPVRTGEQVRLEATVDRPAYLYLIWIDSHGHVDPLYPWARRFDPTTPAVGPISQLVSPPGDDQGWPLVGSGGLETAVLLARRSPLPPTVRLSVLLGALTPSPVVDPTRLLVVRSDPATGDGGAGALRRTRSLGRQSETMDEPLMQLLARLRPHFELIEAYRFAHQSDTP